MILKSDFFRNSGIWITAAAVSGKFMLLLINVFLIRYLSADEFGLLTIAVNFAAFFIPAIGIGSAHGLLKFGAAVEDDIKANIFRYSLKSGFIAHLVLSFIFICSAFLLQFGSKTVLLLSLVMLIRLFGLFYLEQAKAELRADFNNKKYAQLELLTNILAFVFGVGFTLVWGIWGYVFSLCVYPFSVFLFHRFPTVNYEVTDLFKKEFWNYSIKSVLTLLVFMWLFLLDIFFVGRFFSLEDVTFYKISILIPMNLFFVSQIYTQTLYPEICKNHQNRKYLINFIKTYYIIFIPVSLVFLCLGFFFDNEIMQLLGVKNYSTEILRIIFLQMMSIMLLRIPFGNLMGAMGYMGVSLGIGIFMLVGIIVSSFIFLPGSTLVTMAYITLIFITLGGLIAGAFFFNKLFRLKYEN